MLMLRATLAAALTSTTLARRVAVGWVYVADPVTKSAESASWQDIAFEALDVLVVGPVGLQHCNNTPKVAKAFPWRPRFRCQEPYRRGSFGVADAFRPRFDALLAVARQRNPNLQIMASQWYASHLMEPFGDWGGSLQTLGDSEEQLDGYTKDVNAFLLEQNMTGYVLDYEGTNVVHWYTRLLVKLAEAFRDPHTGHRTRHIGISPSTVKYLMGTNSLTDYVFAQTYTQGVELDDFLAIFDANKVFVGLCPEGCSSTNAWDAKDQVELRDLAGIHVWRLNSDNASTMAKENVVMQQVHDLFRMASDLEKGKANSRHDSGFFNLLDSLRHEA